MGTSAAVVRARVEALLEASAVVIATARADGYATSRDVEAAVMAVRAEIAAVLPEVSAVWGAFGLPLHAALRELAERMLDLQGMVAGAVETVELQVDRMTSLIEIAVTYYGDFSRYVDLAALNPDLPHPGRIPPGTTVVRYVE